MDRMDALGLLVGSVAINARVQALEGFARRFHALCSAEITLQWTGVFPVAADFSAVPAPGWAFSTLETDVTLIGTVPLLTVRYKLDVPVDHDRRAELYGSHLHKSPLGLPVVGLIGVPFGMPERSASHVRVGLVVDNLLPSGTTTMHISTLIFSV